ncbi:hypothetical protein CANCADRAFT_45577 [Tortispora caseinolytica NRRL Y-17796]|uniref:Sorting nexin MVP1 n=1 Tax=Tortispora caseinolytica NRRL Y-17796 TaxID=767744 RepID=A0A1E4TBI3_9ASCO|nr:hypothetical protein CANCADRAFT_45577 [Tortispora caseinolytica NRRL Y-17796]
MSLFGEDQDASDSLFGSMPIQRSRDNPIDDSDVQQVSGVWAQSTATNADLNLPEGYSAAKILQGVKVPQIYIDAYHFAGPVDGSVNTGALRDLLSKAHLSVDQMDTIEGIILSDRHAGSRITQNSWNTAMALIALAQQGDTPSLDLIEMRKSNLPIPHLDLPSSAFRLKPDANDSEIGQKIQITTPLSKSPELHTRSISNNTNKGTNTSYRSEPIAAPRPIRPSGASALDPWGSDRLSSLSLHSDQSFPTPMLDGPRDDDTVFITVMPEKEGVFLFRHVTYLIELKGVNKPKVVRRYSDFVWLFEALIKRYPCRIVPVLPPKKLQVNGHYLSSDIKFLERRRRGLTRFVTQLLAHPILSRETLVTMFVSTPTELSTWRKSTDLHIVEEYEDKNFDTTVPESFITNWSTYESLIETTRASLNDAIAYYAQTCKLLDRINTRKMHIGIDHHHIASRLRYIASSNQQLYCISTSETGQDGGELERIADGLISTAKVLDGFQSISVDESGAWDIGVLEDLKRIKDNLLAVAEMFQRFDKAIANNIPQLERRVESNENRLRRLMESSSHSESGSNGNANAKIASEISRLQKLIENDTKQIALLVEREWIIKYNLFKELDFLQNSEFDISKALQNWAWERVKYAELLADTFRNLASSVQSMPISRE